MDGVPERKLELEPAEPGPTMPELAPTLQVAAVDPPPLGLASAARHRPERAATLEAELAAALTEALTSQRTRAREQEAWSEELAVRQRNTTSMHLRGRLHGSGRH